MEKEIASLQRKLKAKTEEADGIRVYLKRNHTSFVSVMKPRLRVSNARYQGKQGNQNLLTDIRYLQIALAGKIPEECGNDRVKLPQLVQKGREVVEAKCGRLTVDGSAQCNTEPNMFSKPIPYAGGPASGVPEKPCTSSPPFSSTATYTNNTEIMSASQPVTVPMSYTQMYPPMPAPMSQIPPWYSGYYNPYQYNPYSPSFVIPATISTPPAAISTPSATISKPPEMISKPPETISKPPETISTPDQFQPPLPPNESPLEKPPLPSDDSSV
jgi:hypothetical protein